MQVPKPRIVVKNTRDFYGLSDRFSSDFSRRISVGVRFWSDFRARTLYKAAGACYIYLSGENAGFSLFLYYGEDKNDLF